MKRQPSLLLCIVMDVLGYASFGVPLLGEVADVVWAPVSAIIFYFMFGGRKAIFGAAFNFAEELLPFTDFIPTFTIAWFWQYFAKKSGKNIIIKPAGL